MNDRDRTDLWTALAVGAVVGIGAALLLRSGEETQTERLIKGLRPVQKSAKRAVRSARTSIGRGARQVGERGEDLLHDAVEALSELRSDAAKIVAQAREELQDAARSSLKEARRSARRTRRRLV